MNYYNLGVKDTLNTVEKILKNENNIDPFAKSILDSLVTGEIHKDTNNLLFMIKENHEIQKILSYITANYLTNGAIHYEARISDIAYRVNIEDKLRNAFYRDMITNEYKYFGIIIDVLTVEKIRDITLNKSPYIDKILKVNKMVEEIKSSILNKKFGCCLMS